MKRLSVFLTLFVTMTLALFAGKPAKTQTAMLVVSCSVCAPDEPMTITGSNFAAHQSVYISVTGPNGLSMWAPAGSRGTFTISYPTGMNFAPGYYTITASEGSLSAVAGFEIQ